MNFSAAQWVASIILDVLIKYLLVAAVGLFVSFGMIPFSMMLTPAFMLSVLNFVCIFLGVTSVASLELCGIRPSLVLRTIVGLAIANILFVGVLVFWLWPGPNDLPRGAEGPVVTALALASTNLFALLIVWGGTRLFR